MKLYRRLKPEETQMKIYFKWVDLAVKDGHMIYAVKNEGKRNRAEGFLQKRLGLRPGICDIVCDIPAGGFYGLRIELKALSPRTGKWGTLSKPQKFYIAQFLDKGYYACCAKGADEAIRITQKYLKGTLNEGD